MEEEHSTNNNLPSLAFATDPNSTNPSSLTTAVAPTKDKVVFIYVLDKENDEQQEIQYRHLSCYAHYHVLSTLLIMGCKQSDAAEIADLVFKWVSEAQSNLKLQQQKQQQSERARHSSSEEENIIEDSFSSFTDRTTTTITQQSKLLKPLQNYNGSENTPPNNSIHQVIIEDHLNYSSCSSNGESGSESEREDDKEAITTEDFSIDSPPTLSNCITSSSSTNTTNTTQQQQQSDTFAGDHSSINYLHQHHLQDSTTGCKRERRKKHRKHKSSRSPYDSGNEVDESDHEHHSDDNVSLTPNHEKQSAATTNNAFNTTFNTTTPTTTPPSKSLSVPISSNQNKKVPLNHSSSLKIPITTIAEQVASSSGSVGDSQNNLGTSPNNVNNPLNNSKKKILRYDKHLKSKSYLVREITYMLKQNRSLKIPQTISKRHERNYVIFLTRFQFQEIIRIALNVFGYSRANRVRDFSIACSMQERRRPLIILFGGTSGTGKSTLASLIASRLGITKVLSTDNIRHMLRAFISKEEEPVLFASTYHAGEALVNTTEGKELKDKLTPDELTVEGFRRQCKLVIEQLEKIIEQAIERNEGLVVEGVHLLTDFIVELMKKHPNSILPYIIYISNQQKHKERFAIRAKYMTLEPRNNKYVKYFQNIRQIQKYLYDRAEVYNVPKIDNTNIDRSIAAIHGSVFKSMKMVFENKKLFNYETGKCSSVHPKSLFDKKHQHWSSKRMLQALQKKRVSLEIKSMTETIPIVVESELMQTDSSSTNTPILSNASNAPLSLSKPSSSMVLDSSINTEVISETVLGKETSSEGEDDKTAATLSNRSRRKKTLPTKKNVAFEISQQENQKSDQLLPLLEESSLAKDNGQSDFITDQQQQQRNNEDPSEAPTIKPISAVKKKKKKLLADNEQMIPSCGSPEEPPLQASSPQNGEAGDTNDTKRYNYYTTSEGVCSLSERDQDFEYGQWIEMDTS